MRHSILPGLLIVPAFVLLSACGGGSSSDSEAANDVQSTSADDPGVDTLQTSETLEALEAAEASERRNAAAFRSLPGRSPAPVAPVGATAVASPNPNASDSERVAAATATARSSSNVCTPARPFYWEVGTASGKLASGSVDSATSSQKITATMLLSIASASKWIYGTYVAQQRGGVLSADDIALLSMRGGYTSFDSCLSSQTVASCQAYGNNGLYDPAKLGVYDYDGGHMQKHASQTGLGAMNGNALASAVMGLLGSDIKLGYSQPAPAGGAYTSADSYAKLLRKIIGNQLQMGSLLGSSPACTNRQTCGSGQAAAAPIPPSESWHYSIGHWVEDDPVTGDGAFSSAGAFGFYPWIDASKTTYGVLARQAPQGAWGSVQCGRLIRKAWMAATAL